MDRETRNHLIWLCLLWVVFSAIGEWLVQLAIDHWPLIASKEGEVTGEAIFFLLRATAPVFTLVVLILLYSAIRFRVPEDDDRPAEAQFASGRLFVAGWVGMSIVLNVLFIIYPGIYGLEALWGSAQAATAADPLDIAVTAKQWEWDFAYPGGKVTTVNELVVPIGRPIRFTLKTEDVMHSFWVPAWGIKKAVIPGETRMLVVTPTKIVSTSADPTMRVQCAQICGVGHALMRSDLRVVSAADYQSWFDGKSKASAPAMGGMKGMNMGGGSGGAMSNGMKMPSGAATMPGMDKSGGGTSGMGGMTMPGASDGTMKPGAGMQNGTTMQPGSGAMPGMDMPGSGADGSGGQGTTDGSGGMTTQPGTGTMPMPGTSDGTSGN